MEAIKRKGKGGKRCRGGARVAGKADAMARISAWQAEASDEAAGEAADSPSPTGV